MIINKPSIVQAELTWNAKGTIIVKLWKYDDGTKRYLSSPKGPDIYKEVSNLNEAIRLIRDNQ